MKTASRSATRTCSIITTTTSANAQEREAVVVLQPSEFALNCGGSGADAAGPAAKEIYSSFFHVQTPAVGG